MAQTGDRESRQPPFFIVGAQRSGTTMSRLTLTEHSRLSVPFESVFDPRFLPAEAGIWRPVRSGTRWQGCLMTSSPITGCARAELVPDPQLVLDQEPRSYPALVNAIFSAYARLQGKERWGDKTPGYVADLDVLNELWPDCRVVHLVRDGRDVALSLAGVSWGSPDLMRNAANWRWKTVLGRKMGTMMGERYLEVRFEDLVREPDRSLRRVCDFLGEHYEPGMLHYPASAHAAMPEQSLQWHRTSISTPDQSRAFEWKRRMSLADQIVFDEVAGDALDLFGYTRVQRRHTIRSRIRFARYALLGHA
ncbi:MAG: sulfotransferase [Halofilum sp. (in: g-proteobacteria)]|nr:sulfotransferase [Halofilum sp. (in: g-proteobacteria)]